MDGGVKTLLLIRHGQSEADLLDVHEGRADFPLTALGRSQAEAMARWVAERWRLDAIFASTLRRAAETAELLSAAAGCPITWDGELMEFDNGPLAGLTRAEADERYPLIPDLPPDRSAYGQETMLHFRQRADEALAHCLERTGRTAAIVSHGGMISQLCASLLGLAPAAPVGVRTGDTGVHCWQVSEGRRALLFANRQEHLLSMEAQNPLQI